MLLENIRASLGYVGNISKQGKDSIHLQVSSLNDITKIINHFDKYPLVTNKLADYILFKKAVELIKNKEHLTIEGVEKIVSIKASMNKGLSLDLKEAFPNVRPVIRPDVKLQETIEPYWLSGFASAECCFRIQIIKSAASKIGYQPQLNFEISQHSRDAELMKSIVNLLGCGIYYPSSNRDSGNFVVRKFSHIFDKVIPFFNKYKIEGIKALDFADFCKLADIINQKGHLTVDGLDEIIKIKAGMNRGRNFK